MDSAFYPAGGSTTYREERCDCWSRRARLSFSSEDLSWKARLMISDLSDLEGEAERPGTGTPPPANVMRAHGRRDRGGDCDDCDDCDY